MVIFIALELVIVDMNRQTSFDKYRAGIGSTPKERSMKKTVPSGGLATDCFFDGTGLQLEIPHKVSEGIARLIALVDC